MFLLLLVLVYPVLAGTTSIAHSVALAQGDHWVAQYGKASLPVFAWSYAYNPSSTAPNVLGAVILQ